MPTIAITIKGTFIENPKKLDDGAYEFSLLVDPVENLLAKEQMQGKILYRIMLTSSQHDALIQEIEAAQEYTIEGVPYLGCDERGEPFIGCIGKHIVVSEKAFREEKKRTPLAKKSKPEKFVDPKKEYPIPPDAPVIFVPIEQIEVVNPIHINAKLNPNKYQILLEKVQKSNMIPEPILVRPTNNNRYELIDGLRRLRVAQELHFSEVPIVIIEE